MTWQDTTLAAPLAVPGRPKLPMREEAPNIPQLGGTTTERPMLDLGYGPPHQASLRLLTCVEARPC